MRNGTTVKKLLWTLAAANLSLLADLEAQVAYAHRSANASPGYYRGTGKGDNQGNPAEQQTLFDVLKELNQKKGVYFLFSNPDLGKQPVMTEVDLKKDVERVLRDILKNTGLKYKKFRQTPMS